MCDLNILGTRIDWDGNHKTDLDDSYLVYDMWNAIFSLLRCYFDMFLYMLWETQWVPKTRPKPDGYGHGYKILPVAMSMSTNFYP
jgi:hypothetical protein